MDSRPIITTVLPLFGLKDNSADITPFGSGLINNTWKVTTGAGQFILQRINDNVFKSPSCIAENINTISRYLRLKQPQYFFVTPVNSIEGHSQVCINGLGYFRLFPFVQGSHTIDVAETPHQAFEAAKQFGRFTKMLSGSDAHKLNITIPDFHNLSLRYSQFNEAIKNGNKKRMAESKSLIDFFIYNNAIVNEYESITNNNEFKIRVTHHDTKISNVLMDKNENGLCVIDLDTVMPGYFISDVGDMIRTYVSPVSEEEKDFSKIVIRKEFYQALVKGYHTEMEDELTGTEKKHFYYSGKFAIYMQGLRFLSDYLLNDVYYKAAYPGHNYLRANNQSVLLKRYSEMEEKLSKYI